MREEITRLGATKEEHERLTAELQRKDEALSQAGAKSQEDSQRITELRSQIEALQQELQHKDEALSQSEAKINERQQELEREKAKKKIPPMSDDDFVKLCMSGDIKKVEEAIMNGANINARDCVGWTALMMAAYKGYINIAEVLIKHGADVNIRTNTWTALSWATRYGHTETADLLRKYGAK